MSLYPFNPKAGQKMQGETLAVTPVDMSFLAHYQITPAAKSATAVHAAIPLTAQTQTITTGITNPDVPRVLTVKGNAGGIAGNVVLTGTDISGAVITDTIALNGSTEVNGTKAFKTLTSIALPVETNAGTDTVSIGRADIFGLPHKVYNALMLLKALFNAATDAGTMAVSATLSLNKFTPAGVPDGAKVLDLFYMV